MPKATDIFKKGILKQKAVFWPAEGTDENGQPVYGDPEECDVRWEDIAKVFLTDKGEESVSRSMVYVDRDMKPDDVLWLGNLNEVDDLTDPLENEKAWTIRYMSKIPNKPATKFVRIATL